MVNRLFAIRIGDHVEVRSAKTVPKVLKSKLTKVVQEQKHRVVYDDPRYPYGKYEQYTVDKKVVLRQVFYVGGRVLGFCKYSRLVAMTIYRIPPDGIVEIDQATKVQILKGTL